MATKETLLINAKDNTKSAFQSVKNNLLSVNKAVALLGGALAGVTLASAMKKTIDNTIAQEKAINQLEQRLKSTKGVVGFTSKELQNFASSMQSVTTYGDEAILQMQSVLLTFTNIRGEAFEKTTEAVLNLSTAMGTDLQSSAVQLGKALNAPTKNMSALTRSGIQFTDAQKEQIKSLEANNDLLGAQQIILDELETQFGGSATALKSTLGGAIDSLGNSFGDLFENVAGSQGLTEAINDLEVSITSPEMKKGFEALTGFVLNLTSIAVDGIRWVADFASGISGIVQMMTDAGEWEYLSKLERLKEIKEKIKNIDENTLIDENARDQIKNKHLKEYNELYSQLFIKKKENTDQTIKESGAINDLAFTVVDLTKSVDDFASIDLTANQTTGFWGFINGLRDKSREMQEFRAQMHLAWKNSEITAKEYDQALQQIGYNTEETKETTSQWQKVAVSGIKGISDSLVDMAISGETSFRSFARSFLINISKMIVQAQLLKAIGLTSAGATTGGGIIGALFSAKGNAFDNGKVQAFASGGIVSSPTLFGYSGGLGVMGEAGSEAILPLKRGANGDLGVQVQGGSGGVVINQNINVTGTGDKNLIEAMRRSAQEGAKQGYALVMQDFSRNGAIRGMV